MTNNADALAAHDFGRLATALSGWRADQPDTLIDEIEASHPGFFDRLSAVSGLLNAVTSAADPDLVSQALAATTRQYAETVINTLANIAAGSREPYLSQIENDYLPTLTSSLASWPYIRVDSEEDVAAVAGAFRRATDAAVADVRTQAQELRRETEARRVEIAETDAALGRAREELAQLRQAIDAQRVRLDEIGASAQTSFAEAEGRRTTDFAATLSEVRSTADTDMEELHHKYEQRITADRDRAQKIIEEMTEKKIEAERLVSIIGTVGTAGFYQKEANSQKEAADTWRWIAVGLSLVAIAIAIYIIASHDTATSGEMVGKIVAAISAGGIAAYAAKQSGDHRRREEAARRTELELVAFAPFVEGLDEAQRLALRKEVAQRLFVDGAPAISDGGGAKIDKDTISVLQQLLQVLGLNK